MRNETKILKPNKLKTIGFLLISCFFVIFAFNMIKEEPLMGWIGISFFGLGIIVFIIQLLPNSTYLKLTNEGFEIRNLYKSDFTKRSDVKVFKIGTIPMHIYGGYVRQKKMVMLDYVKTHKKHRRGKMASKALSGSHGALPDSYGKSIEELVQIMNEWKSKNVVQH